MDAKVNKIFIFSLFGVVLASALHLYPALNRMILFLFPFVIIFISSVFDFKMKNVHFDKALTIFIIVFSLLFFILFDAKIICKNRNNIILDCCRGRDLAIILKENFNKDDILIISKFNECFYRYYAFLLNINIDNVIILNPPENRKFVEFLTAQNEDKAESDDKNYWIFIPCDFMDAPISKAVQDIKKTNVVTVLYSLHPAQNSYLYKVKI